MKMATGRRIRRADGIAAVERISTATRRVAGKGEILRVKMAERLADAHRSGDNILLLVSNLRDPHPTERASLVHKTDTTYIPCESMPLQLVLFGPT